MSLQNLWPRLDRRALAVAVCGIATALALLLDISNYFNFLYLLGSVFVPLTAVFLVDYFLGRGRRAWDTSDRAPARWPMVLPWLAGFAVYQLIYPGGISWWVSAWQWIAARLHFTPADWMSASVGSFVVAALLTVPAAVADRRRSS
jgi:purine-cytosine permease-like protein